jgi:hypothetical protein
MVQRRTRRRVVTQLDQQLPDLVLEIAAASTAPVATRRMARWWNPASTTRAKNPGRAPMRTRLERVTVWPEWEAGSL